MSIYNKINLIFIIINLQENDIRVVLGFDTSDMRLILIQIAIGVNVYVPLFR